MDKLDIEASDDLLVMRFNERTVFKKSFDQKKLASDSLKAKFLKKESKLVIKYSVV